MSETPKQRVLLVDDEPSLRENIAELLTKEGYKVSTTENEFDGLLQTRRAIPDLIISDLTMPQMSGLEFLSILRRRFPEIPVVAISGAHTSGDQVPGGIIDDAFYAKRKDQSGELLRVRYMIEFCLSVCSPKHRIMSKVSGEHSSAAKP